MSEFLFPKRTLEQETNALASFLPDGRMFNAKWIESTKLRGLLKGLSGEFLRLDELVNQASFELDPRVTTDLIEEWESMMGIPDDCFKTVDELTLQERRNQVLAKLAAFGASTAEDFENIAEILGFNITILPGSAGATWPYKFPFKFPDPKKARFTMFVRVNLKPGEVEAFPYQFPFQFPSVSLSALECFFRNLIPANVILQFEFTDNTGTWGQQNTATWSNQTTPWSSWA